MPLDADLLLTGRCPRWNQPCPMAACRGLVDPAACDHWHRLNAWRDVSGRDQAVQAEAATRSALDPRLRDAVNGCPNRGSVLPVSAQEDCGCRGGELSRCRAGRGKQPGKVTLGDCLACRTAALADQGDARPDSERPRSA